MLKYFILGVITYNVFIPLTEAVGSLFIAKIEQWKAKINVGTTISNSEMDKIMRDSQETVSYPIGFQIPSGEDEEDEDE